MNVARSPNKQIGMTLIEVLVAMSLLAVLSVLGYKAFSALLISRQHLMTVSEQWLTLARLFRRIELDLRHVEASEAISTKSLQLGANGDTRHLLLHVYSQQTHNKKTIDYLAEPTGLYWRDRGLSEQAYLLLEPTYQVSWRILSATGSWLEQWPTPGHKIPTALEMRIVHPTLGTITRIWNIR